MLLIVDIHLSSDDYLRWYQGSAKAVVATSRDGRRVRFPAESLRPFVTHSGVHGSFAIHFNEHNRLVKVEKLD